MKLSLLISLVLCKTTAQGILALSKNATFLSYFGECDFFARQSIRGVFHDATSRSLKLGNNGAVDGSLQYELDWIENRMVSQVVEVVQEFVSSQVTFSDAFVLSSVLSLRSCQGPNVPFAYGRTDATKAGPEHLLFPEIAGSDEQEIRIQDMGMTFPELLALVAGGHSVATTQGQTPFDATPERFDTDFVHEILQPRSQGDLQRVRIQSDIAMANDPIGRPLFKQFEQKPLTMFTAFSKAFEKLCNLGWEGQLTTIKV
jgi:catalase (peroxidase I)